jgi:radical SAM protein with 4Fe4S-binding SPASM domain
MDNQFNGLSVVNIELTSRCNKRCFCCGRRKLEKLKKTDWGDMKFSVVKSIAEQLPDNIIVQLHFNGEPLLYPELGKALSLFTRQIRCLSTNGKLIIEKEFEIIDNLDTMTISVIENDPEGNEQYELIKHFLKIKGNKKPFMVYRLLGDVTDKQRWHDLPGIVATRVLHNPMGSFGYKKKVTIPEVGICMDLLSHLVIDRYGNCFPCVRFNPNKDMMLGNVTESKLIDLWNNPHRLETIKQHINGNRKYTVLCSTCEFYGCPTSY